MAVNTEYTKQMTRDLLHGSSIVLTRADVGRWAFANKHKNDMFHMDVADTVWSNLVTILGIDENKTQHGTEKVRVRSANGEHRIHEIRNANAG